MPCVGELVERDLRACVGRDLPGLNDFAALQANAVSVAAVIDQDLCHVRVASNLHAHGHGGAGHRLGECAHAAAHVAPYPARTTCHAHDVMQQHVTGARSAGRCESADDSIGGKRPLELRRFKPAIQHRRGGAGENFNGFGQVFAQFLERLVQRAATAKIAQAIHPAQSTPLRR